MGEIRFDRSGLDSSAEPGNPSHDGVLTGWQEGAVGVCEATDGSKGDE